MEDDKIEIEEDVSAPENPLDNGMTTVIIVITVISLAIIAFWWL